MDSSPVLFFHTTSRPAGRSLILPTTAGTALGCILVPRGWLSAFQAHRPGGMRCYELPIPATTTYPFSTADSKTGQIESEARPGSCWVFLCSRAQNATRLLRGPPGNVTSPGRLWNGADAPRTQSVSAYGGRGWGRPQNGDEGENKAWRREATGTWDCRGGLAPVTRG